jgi:hypothetical protein
MLRPIGSGRTCEICTKPETCDCLCSFCDNHRRIQLTWKTEVLNLFCKIGQHDKCIGVSKGTKSDPETFVCICNCHKTTSKQKK